ncbi:hypothetical protein DPEC_G00082060 [Dallia pectoralis]|uniref:Uncharacterized protein n=1 Tax=Dallia pectoralis TaxID=75939 RepID=A0ACC2GYG5_DALPE|nr:hypothetical protein DPEC_G00082060 [Dallia pectoralis]
MKVDDKLQILKFFSTVVNCVFLILGLCIFGCGVWILFDKSNFVTVLSSVEVKTVAVGLFVIGLVVVGVTILGCIGAQLENRCFLLLYMGFLICIVLGQLFVTFVLLLKWNKIETTMVNTVDDTIRDYGSNPVHQTYWKPLDDVQRYGKCCGRTGPNDWQTNLLIKNSSLSEVFPCSCFNTTACPFISSFGTQLFGNGNETYFYPQGCQEKITSWLQANILTIVGMDVGLILIQILQFVLSVYLYQTVEVSDFMYFALSESVSWTTVMTQQGTATFPELIRKKRDGEQLSGLEIRHFVQGVKNKTIQEGQIGAMLMAIWQNGMLAEETLALTNEMLMSGEVMAWPSQWEGLVVDKHSTGGVGDKISLVLAPALAACGCKVPMISGRGLAHTGGTLDKLESIPGLNICQPVEQLHRILEEVGCCIVGQTENLVPADKVMYALRDATSTVNSLPLITGSIMSKKGAESLSALVLDVKFGKAALYKDLSSARELAQSLVTVGNSLGIRTGAVLSHMNCPIGRCVGNSLEVIESLECLKGRAPDDILELVESLGGLLLLMTGRASDLTEGKKAIADTLQNGTALEKFRNMIIGQGVTNQMASLLCSAQADYHSVLRRAPYQTNLETESPGTVLDIDGMVIAVVLQHLGAGRSKVGQAINHSVGAELLVSLGQKVEKGQPWLRVHYETLALTAEQRDRLRGAITLGSADQLHTHPLVAEVIMS